jgi:hypothetical protein
MKITHYSFPVGESHSGTLKFDCPYSLSLRWRWGDRHHALDAVLYGELEVTGDPIAGKGEPRTT